MDIEELKKDSEEFTKLLEQTSRHRCKDVLTQAKAEVDKEIVNLEMKAQLAAKRTAIGNTQKRYLKELTEYAWDQSDKFVKLYVTLEGIQNSDEPNVNVTFNENSVNLLINNFNDKDYKLTINNLLLPIDIEKSYPKVKAGIIVIYMKKKAESIKWNHLTTIEKRLKELESNEFNDDNDSGDPMNALNRIMKKMYNSGDPKVKQMMAKAWAESQEKINKGDYPMDT